MQEKIRLDKLLAHSNYGSRKEVKILIRQGRVMVNGEVILDDDYKVQLDDEIFVEGYQVDYQKEIYLMLNKPQGVITATEDDYHQTVLDLLDVGKGAFPVGRLDIDTEGLILITNDGKLCHTLLSPKHDIKKVYYLEFSGVLSDEKIKKFAKGIVLDDNYVCRPASFEKTSENSGYITISEGKFHQVKRMLAALDCQVTFLKRIKMGPLVLDESLALGQYRKLSEEEIEALKKL